MQCNVGNVPHLKQEMLKIFIFYCRNICVLAVDSNVGGAFYNLLENYVKEYVVTMLTTNNKKKN